MASKYAEYAEIMVALLLFPLGHVASIHPPHSWDTLSGMSFFHSCNESGPFSERALDTITKFPLVTIEKGQGFNDPDCTSYGAPGFPCAESKIISQCAAIKKRNSSIATVFYYNAVLDWYAPGSPSDTPTSPPAARWPML